LRALHNPSFNQKMFEVSTAVNVKRTVPEMTPCSLVDRGT
jgi:hypothetical protein